MNVNLPPEMKGGVPFGIGSGISNLSAGYQDYGESLRVKQKIQQIESKIDSDRAKSALDFEDNWKKTMEDWNDMWVETQDGIADIKTSWADTAQMIIETGNLFSDILNTIMSELGYDMSGWKYKDPKLEAERQAQMKAYEKETTPIGWFNKVMGWANQAAGVALPMMMAEGGSGVVTKPTMFIAGERGTETFDFRPVGKGGRSGIGGTHVEIHQIVVPDTWDRQRAENVVVQAYEDAVRHGRIN